jgi:GlpG protein
MKEFVALSVDASEDLKLFSSYLLQEGIRHRVIESGSKQEILVGRQDDVALVQGLYKGMSQGMIGFEQVGEAPRSRANLKLMATLRRQPVVIVFVLLSLMGAVLIELDTTLRWSGWLMYTHPSFAYQSPFDALTAGSALNGQWWRMLTPIFLHFSLLHIVFNMLWFWEFGRKIEIRLGSLFMLGLICGIAVVSNVVQGMFTPSGVFGGMSGVIAGLLGFSVVWDKILPERAFAIPSVIVWSMLAWLLLCLFGAVTFLTGSQIANAAHMSGLASGAVFGAFFALIERRH